MKKNKIVYYNKKIKLKVSINYIRKNNYLLKFQLIFVKMI